MRQLLPVLADVADLAEVYADLPDADGRPGVRLNMIASADGAATVAGRSGGLGGPADKALFMTLRGLTDAVLVGAGTARDEGYGPAVLPAEVQAARQSRGQAPVPPIAVLSRRCNLDWSSRFFGGALARPLVVTAASAPPDARSAAAEVADVVIAGDEEVDLARALAALGERGFRSVLAEGGPSINGQLALAGLLDELCLTVAPLLAGGGDARRILTGPALPASAHMTLRSLLESDGYLFLRYRVTRA